VISSFATEFTVYAMHKSSSSYNSPDIYQLALIHTAGTLGYGYMWHLYEIFTKWHNTRMVENGTICFSGKLCSLKHWKAYLTRQIYHQMSMVFEQGAVVHTVLHSDSEVSEAQTGLSPSQQQTTFAW